MNPNKDTTFQQWLRRRRQELDLTQDRLADLTGYASPTIQKVERGERRPSRDLAMRLADALAIPDHERAAFLHLARSPGAADHPAPAGNRPTETTPLAGSNTPQHASGTALPLLRTRIQPPPVRPHFVSRRRLVEQLQLNQGGTLTLVAAPAGWGKTTLLSMWVAALPAEDRRRVTWLALDAAESEPVRLLQYVVAPLQLAEPALGAAALSLLATPQLSLDVALLLLANDLAGLAQPLEYYPASSGPGEITHTAYFACDSTCDQSTNWTFALVTPRGQGPKPAWDMEELC